MAMVSVAPKSASDGRISEYLNRHARRVGTCPPGTCPLVVQLSLLQTSGAQTCGKCVPCRDGIPRLAGMLERIVNCEADGDALESLRALAEMIRDTADCAIGYEAADAVLAGLDSFADEYRSHIERRTCSPGVGQTVPCETMCPAHVDVPAYIAFVAEGDYASAINTIRKDNPFPTACAFVCEHPCEERCRRTLIDAPINIRGVKKFAVDQVPADSVPVPQRSAATGRTVAVIGGGPSGLTCAYYLALMGHAVTVYEGKHQLGGMLRYGIPAYRFPRERLDEDIRAILSAGGIEVRCDTLVGEREMDEIVREFDAVYVAIGAQAGKTLRIENDDAEGVVPAIDLLNAVGEGNRPDYTGKKVIVVGGGNVAMDCARTAVRAGADEVSIVYRRRKEDMTALPAEVESAMAEGVEMITLEAPVAVEVDGRGRCAALVTQPQMIGPVRGGRPSPLAADKPQRRIEADAILVAVGQGVAVRPFEDFGLESARGCLVTDEYMKAKGRDTVFAGGECCSGSSTVIREIGAGKVAARNIDEFLGYHHTLDSAPSVPEPRSNDRTPRGRVEVAERPARVRKHDFSEVEEGMSREEAKQECGRCLRCDCFGCGTTEDGRQRYA